jgi:5'(3')-deoxyribonucleotidase
MTKKIVYVDMDGVLADFESAIYQLSPSDIEKYKEKYEEIQGFFATIKPIKGAIEGYRKLCTKYDVYILSTPPWKNASGWSDKLRWVQYYLGDIAEKRLILTHHKELAIGDYLIDDRYKNGADKFRGKHLLFGSDEFPDWDSIIEYFKL